LFDDTIDRIPGEAYTAWRYNVGPTQHGDTIWGMSEKWCSAGYGALWQCTLGVPCTFWVGPTHC